MRFIRRLLKAVFLLLLLLTGVYFLGPKVDKPLLTMNLPAVESNLAALQKRINERESLNTKIKANNESQIIWYDSIPSKTEYAILYLHGWSASREEGAPLHMELGQRYGANVYLPRLEGHGIQEEQAMLHLTATDYFESAKEALAIAKQIGKKVIVMGTSTGGTLALYLTQEDKDIAALLLYSPNVKIFDPTAVLLSGPWGLEIAKTVMDSDFYESEADSLKRSYWTTRYRVEALTQLQALLDVTMKPEVFQRIHQPIFMGYYYKNEEEQDKVVSVPALLEMYDELGVGNHLKRKVAFPEVGNHVMTSYITSKDLESVRKETIGFLEEIVQLQPVN
ncbi:MULTISPECIES: carboxylesterase [unclassified Arenibacter]|uniref:alpha/beta hydrolase n=1 Tax=unclassified Arenibacter TaxID=2615047 RepID=UPI000E34588C|nr:MULTISPECIES: alpha/beta fold hydrolase [unclassified Arenibacter]MCM4165872.1 alpha/beta hydrolase [Arenibacter sp. A80]RFT54490.1 alpha/beta fold hydrolase [Arenibacter sp. P308M17]